MSISGLGNSLFDSLNAFNLKDLLRGKNGKDLTDNTSLEALAPNTVSAIQSIPNGIGTNSGQSNMMAGNFASSDREQSKYITATLKGFQQDVKLENQAKNQIVSILSATKTMYEGAETAGERYKAIKWAEKHLALNQSREVEKAAEDGHLKEAKREIEKAAQEATAPKDANGNPILDANDAGSEPAPVAEPAPTPTTETVDVAAAQAGSAAVAEVATSEIASAPAAPAAQVSIDIRV